MKIFEKGDAIALFVTRKSRITHLNTPVNLILSPQYYWVKKAALPVTRTYEAKKYAPALFEEQLPPGGSYSYLVSKTDTKGTFIVVAYDAEHIVTTLKAQIADFSKVRKICFSQFELQDMPACLRLEEGASLYRNDDLILYAPAPCSIGEAVTAYTQGRRLSRHCITPATLRDERVPARYAYSMIAALLLLGAGFGLELFYHLREKAQIRQQVAEVMQRYHLPATSMQRDSVLHRVTKVAQRERKVRDLLQRVATMPTAKGSRVEAIELGQDGLRLKISVKDPALQERIMRHLAEGAKVGKVSYDNGLYEVVLR